MSYNFYGLDQVQLAAPEDCEAEARNFFANLLGWTEIPKPEILQKRGGVWFQCGAHQVHVGIQKDFVPVQNLEKLRQYLLHNKQPSMGQDPEHVCGQSRIVAGFDSFVSLCTPSNPPPFPAAFFSGGGRGGFSPARPGIWYNYGH